MLATIVGLAFFLYLKPELESQIDAEFQISVRDPNTVQTIKIIRHGEQTTLHRREDQWYLTSPFYGRADTETIGNILNILSANSRQRFLMTDHEDFNLDQPVIELYLDDDYFAFGGLAPTTDQQYLAINRHVYLVSPRYAIWIPVKPIDAVSAGLLSDDEIPVTFDFKDFSVQQSGINSHGWQLVDRESGQPITDLSERWVQLWRASQASELIIDQQIRLSAQSTVELTLENGRIIPFQVWHDENGTVIFRDNESVGYYFSDSIGQQLLNPHRIE